MTTHIYDAGKAAWVNENMPTMTYVNTPSLSLDGQGPNEKRAFVWFPNPFTRHGDQSSGASLIFHLANAWPGANILTAKRITAPWKQKSVKWGNTGANPTVTATNAGTVTVTDGSAGQRVVMNVDNMMADVADGDAWHGVRLEIDTNQLLKLVSPDGAIARRPRLEVSITSLPDDPDLLSPDDVYIDSAYPVFSWEFNSSDDNAFQQASRILVTDVEGDYSSPVYDTGFVTNTTTSFDPSTDDTPPAFAVGEFWWTVTVEDQNGNTSDPSEEASFIREPMGDVNITDPGADDDDVADSTPTITVYSDFDADAIRWRLLDADDVVLYERPWAVEDQAYEDEDSYVYQWTVPSNVPNRAGNGDPLISEPNATYKVQVDMRDEFARPWADTATDTRSFQFVPAWADTATTALASSTINSQPWVDLTWTRGQHPRLLGNRAGRQPHSADDRLGPLHWRQQLRLQGLPSHPRRHPLLQDSGQDRRQRPQRHGADDYRHHLPDRGVAHLRGRRGDRPTGRRPDRAHPRSSTHPGGAE